MITVFILVEYVHSTAVLRALAVLPNLEVETEHSPTHAGYVFILTADDADVMETALAIIRKGHPDDPH